MKISVRKSRKDRISDSGIEIKKGELYAIHKTIDKYDGEVWYLRYVLTYNEHLCAIREYSYEKRRNIRRKKWENFISDNYLDSQGNCISVYDFQKIGDERRIRFDENGNIHVHHKYWQELVGCYGDAPYYVEGSWRHNIYKKKITQ